MDRAIFWDLLGTLGGNSRTLINQDFEFYDEAIPAMREAAKNHYLNIIITNQSHISHGRITMEEYNDSLEKLLDELEENGVEVAEVYTCPHARKDKCRCKKPLPKFINEAIKKYDLNPSESYVVGDSGKNDMVLAKNAGVKSILVLTGEGIESLTKNRALWSETKPTHIAENSLDAVSKIIE